MTQAGEVRGSDVVARNPEAVARRLDDLAFVMHPHRRELHHFNETAWFVWEHIDGTRRVDELAALLAAEYDVDAGQARADVAELVAALLEKDLVTLRREGESQVAASGASGAG